MKRFFSKTAFTLIELIISLLLMSVIILGIYSIQQVLNSNTQDYGQRYLIKSETQIILDHMLTNANLAVGDVMKGDALTNSYNNQDYSILYGASNPPGVNDANTFCIHQAANSNISGTGSPLWLCYTWYPSTDGTYPNQIVYCTFPYQTATASPSFRGALPCKASNGPTTGPTFLGTSFAAPAVTFVATTGSFTVTLKNCINNAPSGTCDGTSDGVSSDPVNNPEVKLSGTVFPPQEGAG